MDTIKAIASKSDGHRALIAAHLCKDMPQVLIDDMSQDLQASLDCMEAIRNKETNLYCKESGTTFRILLPLVGALGHQANFHLGASLATRPLSPLYEVLQNHGMVMSDQGSSTFRVRGKLEPGDFKIRGDVSSQFISGLLFATPLLDGDSKIYIQGDLESASYVDMTLDTLKKYSIKVKEKDYGYKVQGGQTYQRTQAYKVEGDWSNASFFLVAGALMDQGLKVKNLNMASLQGDKEIINILEKMGAQVQIGKNSVQVSKARLKAMDIDASNIVDIVPILSILASQAEGKTRFFNASRLRFKESDRIKTTVKILEDFGIETDEYQDSFAVYGNGGQGLGGNYFQSFGDHRIAMSVAIGSIIAKDPVHLSGYKAAHKSYPRFFQDLASLGLDRKLVLEED